VLRHSLEEKGRYIQASKQLLLQKFVDGEIPKEAFDDGHARLLLEQKACDETMERLDDEQEFRSEPEDKSPVVSRSLMWSV
jgi:hypothetical protein